MLRTYFQCFVYDARQSYLRQTRRRRSRSFVQGFLKLQYPILGNRVASLSATSVDGFSVEINETVLNNFFHALLSIAPGRGGIGMGGENGTTTASANADLWSSSINNGIVVGTGTTAVAPTDFQLATQITDGTSSGTLEHFPSSGTNFSTSGSTASFDLERLFRNSSSGSITITEVGVYSGWSQSASDDMNHFCILRDLVSPGFTVANGEYLRIVYTVSVTA